MEQGLGLFVLVVVFAGPMINEAHCRHRRIAHRHIGATRNVPDDVKESTFIHIIQPKSKHKSCCSKMFSWSSKGHKASGYPGARSSGGGSGSGVSRDEHIQSYLNDPTLKPSTRRVSAGENALDALHDLETTVTGRVCSMDDTRTTLSHCSVAD